MGLLLASIFLCTNIRFIAHLNAQFIKDEKVKSSAELGDDEEEDDSETSQHDTTNFNASGVPGFLRGSISPDVTAYRTVSNATVIPMTLLMILNLSATVSVYVDNYV